MDIPTVIGVFGASTILIGFLLNQLGKVTTESRLYDGLNVLGSLLLIIYAVLLVSYPFIILNVVWLVVSIQGLVKPSKLSE
jgi:hypothetical protein